MRDLGLDTPLGAKHKALKLNESIQVEERAGVCNKLKRGKVSAHLNGLCAEFLKDPVVKEFEDDDGSNPVYKNLLCEPVHNVINSVW